MGDNNDDREYNQFVSKFYNKVECIVKELSSLYLDTFTEWTTRESITKAIVAAFSEEAKTLDCYEFSEKWEEYEGNVETCAKDFVIDVTGRFLGTIIAKAEDHKHLIREINHQLGNFQLKIIER